MSKNTGGAAFPLNLQTLPGDDPVLQYPEAGMTLRDYFAGQALAAIATRNDAPHTELMAALAYKVADAMLVERSRG